MELNLPDAVHPPRSPLPPVTQLVLELEEKDRKIALYESVLRRIHRYEMSMDDEEGVEPVNSTTTSGGDQDFASAGPVKSAEAATHVATGGTASKKIEGANNPKAKNELLPTASTVASKKSAAKSERSTTPASQLAKPTIKKWCPHEFSLQPCTDRKACKCVHRDQEDIYEAEIANLKNEPKPYEKPWKRTKRKILIHY
ncbi:hypothetical protein BDV95DRAFT_614360 [Massariosphaeria phaeospora]|uniref:Uncharacterized protein n=1 Tax=Massariosphaeria phaeospora TaxID=100035 RepID=A0A7C8IDT8_9PLEO|nr:hypothetical protein BDV95DRAFT_614360 [Massariosphaeria phaeospora]